MLSIVSYGGRIVLVLGALWAALLFVPAFAPLQALIWAALGALWAALRLVLLGLGGAMLLAWLSMRIADSGWVYPDEHGQLPVKKSFLKRHPELSIQTTITHQKIRVIRAQHPLAGVTHYSPRYMQSTAEALPAPAPPMPVSAWFPTVVEHDAHLLLLGPTRSGKSTLARAVLAERARTDKVIILDPHGRYNDWGGLPAIGDGRDFDRIEKTIYAIHAEFERRFKPGEDMGQPLSVFIDETPALAAERKHLIPYITKWLREAAKAKIRVVVLSQGWEVRALGIEGEGSIRENFKTVKLGTFAIDELPEAEQHAYPAVLVHGNGKGVPRLIDTSGLPERAQAALSPAVVWQPDPALLTDGSSSRADGSKDAEIVDPGPTTTDRERILALHRQGVSMSKIAHMVYGYAAGAAFRKVKAVLDETEAC